MELPSPYFLQTRQWADFWLKANGEKHEVYQIACEIEVSGQPVVLTAFIYQYPWHLGQNFLYIPKGPFLGLPTGVVPGKTQFQELLDTFFQQTSQLAKSLKATFTKIDFDDNFITYLGLRDNEHLREYLQTKFQKYQFNFDSKRLQYLQTLVLDCRQLQTNQANQPAPETNPSLENLQHFFQNNADFWAQVNQTTRRNTRKSLEAKWSISTQKTLPNFNSFWQLIQETSQRQGFNTHSKNYYQQLFNQDFSRLIILRDNLGKAQGAWFGLNLHGTLTYLYGGNISGSRKHHGQYLIHLAALHLASQENCQFYDLGGYEAGKGYGQFKEGYKGYLRAFLGPVDLVHRSTFYAAVIGLIQSIKGFRGLGKALVSGQLKTLDMGFKFLIGLLITTTAPLWIFTLLAYWPQNPPPDPAKIEVAIVFGASIDFVNLQPSLVLQNRLDKAIELYSSGQVRTILVSGDNREPDYNEPYVMKKYLVDRGVEPASVVEDFGGRRTADTCWRAKNVFKAEKVYLITQRFHLPRAEFNCDQMGLQTIPVAAENSSLRTTFWGVVREMPASWLALEEALGDYQPPVVADGTETNVESDL
jgi:vancomycin permeability regulator SanA/lipid II:glycine glycyltransferase (peptidoglycan interpeptide bridge formation enzyme)